jgi:AcrR family transcriptional regulator
MPRSGKEARARLRQAAIDLFLERGFDAVTTAEIAERAGVTERTYFRHFPDKREVLFDSEDQLAEQLAAALVGVPPTTPALLTLQLAFRGVAPMLERNRLAAQRLGQIVASTPALWERAAAKEARLVEMLTAELSARGIDQPTAALAARTGWGVVAQATHCWQADPTTELEEHVNRAFDRLQALVAGHPQTTEPHRKPLRQPEREA